MNSIRWLDRRYHRGFSVIGVFVTALVLGLASLGGPLLTAFGMDPRPFVAALPVIYAVVLAAGVAWLAWSTFAPPRRPRRR